MTVHVVKVPDIGEGIAEVELVEWYVQAGDTIEADQVLADLMTDKATVEVPAPVAGKVVALGGKAGDKLAVGSELARIELDGGDPHPRPAPRTEAAAPPPRPVERGEGRGEGLATGPAPSEPGVLGKPLASPSVRRHARELGVDLAQVRGSGPDGRILHDDVAGFATRGARPPIAARHAERVGEKAVPVIGLRRQIAQRMQESLRIPHFSYVEEIDVTELEALRARINAERAAARGHLTVLPFLMRAIVLAVPAFPHINARYDDAKGIVTQYAPVHLGIATQTEGGLMVPVVRHAETKDLWASAAEVTRLAAAARGGKATREELTGSTITITSLGPQGGIVTTPIINSPEVAIVGVNRIVERPMWRSGAVLPRLMMNLSSSFDHRVIDGASAAQFVQALRGYLECPALLFVD